MGVKAALIENEYEEGSKEYKYLYEMMFRFQAELFGFKCHNITERRCKKLNKYIRTFEERNLKFTVGNVDYLELIEFIEVSHMIITNGIIRSYLGKFLNTAEINPVYYGNKKYDLKPLIEKIRGMGLLVVKESEV